jgi:hypothetical protein
LLTGLACAEDAVRPDGQRIKGRLSLDAAHRLCFTPAGKDAPLALDSIQDIRFPAAEVPPLLVGAPQRVEFGNEQHITGELLRMDPDAVHLRTCCSEDLKLPRRAVVDVTQPAGLATLFHEDFDADPIRMQLAGSPPLDTKQRTSGRRSLVLNKVGQSALHVLPTPLDAGRIGLHFRDSGDASGARWLVEATFANQTTSRQVSVLLAGDGDSWTVESDVPSSESRRIPRTVGWHRLSIRFRREYLLVGVDDRLLFESGKDGPGAPLKQVRLVCKKRGPDESERGAVHFDDLTLAQSLVPLVHGPGDPTQDELWLASGDQLFGHVERADSRTVTLRARSGTRDVAWANLRGIFPERDPPSPQTSDGAHVRIWFRSGLGSEPDQLEGVLQELSDDKFVLHHAVLGDVGLERSRLVRLRPLFHGRLMELETAAHHLGDAGRLVPGLVPPRARGPSLRHTFRLDAVPNSARLIVTVQHLQGPADGIREQLQRGDLRTEIVVNGRPIDYLNRFVDRAVKEPLRLHVVIPTAALRVGDNTLEVRQTPDRATGRHVSCILQAMAVELPR